MSTQRSLKEIADLLRGIHTDIATSLIDTPSTDNQRWMGLRMLERELRSCAVLAESLADRLPEPQKVDIAPPEHNCLPGGACVWCSND